MVQIVSVLPVGMPGVSLRRQVRNATVEVLDGVVQLLGVLLSSPLQTYVYTHTPVTDAVSNGSLIIVM